MPKKPPCQTKKLHGGLYGAAWVGKYCIVAGGGGSQGNTGISNSITCVEHSNGVIGEVVNRLDLGKETPLRMTVSMDGSILVVAVHTGGLCLIHLDVSQEPPTLQRLEDNEDLRGLGEVKSMDFSQNNRLLAVGTVEGFVHVFAWPSLRKRASFRCGETSGDCVRDLTFSSSHNDRVLATAHENGSCKLWDLVTGSLIETLRIPPESQAIKKNPRGSPRFSQVAFTTSIEKSTGLEVPTLIAAVIVGKQSQILTWAQKRNGQLGLQKEIKAHKAPVTAMALSRDGEFLGCGSGDGDLALFSTEDWRCTKRANGAHLVFATAAAFSDNSQGFISVSADSGLCTLMTTHTRRAAPLSIGLSTILMTMAFIIIILAVLLSLVNRKYGSVNAPPFFAQIPFAKII